MLRTIFALLIFFASTNINAQDSTAESSALAPVDVVVTNLTGRPSKGEQILFRSNSSAKSVSGISDAKGKFSLKLPAGDSYTITVKSITDTTKYGSISIPALKPDEFFSEPFKVNIKFEPARTYTLQNVHFDSGKSTLRPESMPALEELYDYLKIKDDINIEIAGHTDSIGKADNNLKLSQERAETIRSFLIKKGITASRIVAKGYGSTEPVADNETEEGRQQNRRTEVRIL